MARTAPTERLHRGAARTPLAEGDLALGRYRLERCIGAGGHGVVWLAHDEKLERDVAVKAIPRRGTGGAPTRAEREARVAARLSHPGLVALYELGRDDDAIYLVYELVHGWTFDELEEDGALSDRDVAQIGKAICDALMHAHACGVVHRDVKPQNVIVLAEPAAGAGFAKLTDFGVAHVSGDDPLTHTGDVLGTLAYMAPEQADGLPATTASDVYSLALMLYEGWTGVNPVRADGAAATARRLGRRLPRLQGRRRDLPADLCETIDAALDPVPERRPGLSAVGAALETSIAALSEEGGLVEPGTIERLGLARARRRSPRRLLSEAVHAPASGWLTRFGAGAGTAGLVLAAAYGLGGGPPVDPLAAAGVAWLLVSLLPRVGWLIAAAVTCGWLASLDAGQEGTALVLAIALAPVPLLLPRAGWLWSLPVLAPLLGLIALAPAFVAVAGLASTAWRRAGLAAAGFVWLLAGEVLTGRTLLFGAPAGVPDRSAWEGSAMDAAADTVQPFLTSPALAPVVVWAALAAVLPMVVRRRAFALDVLGGALWAAALVGAHGAVGELLASSGGLSEPRGALAGAAIGAIAAVAWRRPWAGARPAAPRLGEPAVP